MYFEQVYMYMYKHTRVCVRNYVYYKDKSIALLISEQHDNEYVLFPSQGSLSW